uniref:Uncharacterized protein n=1 Tax=Ditylenchus dipsaci TaxID=166011 RepID=A0A915CLI0_9BILA
MTTDGPVTSFDNCHEKDLLYDCFDRNEHCLIQMRDSPGCGLDSTCSSQCTKNLMKCFERFSGCVRHDEFTCRGNISDCKERLKPTTTTSTTTTTTTTSTEPSMNFHPLNSDANKKKPASFFLPLLQSYTLFYL